MATEPRSSYFYASRVLLIIALLVFVLAAFGVKPGPVEMVPAGLAFFAASFLIP